MSLKKLLLIGVGALLIVNVVIVGGLYFGGVIFQPSTEELAAQEAAAAALKEAEEEAAKYAHLEPLPEFKSRAGYVSSMGEAVDICTIALNEKVPVRKAWSVNYIESRYLPKLETYKVFIDYQTVVKINEEAKYMKATCDVNEATKSVAEWGAMKAE